MENSNHENKKSLMRDIFLKSRLSLSEKENLKEKEAEDYFNNLTNSKGAIMFESE